MPLIIIGIVFVIALIVYVKAGKAADSSDSRPVRERYPEVFKGAFFNDDTQDEQSQHLRRNSVNKNSDEEYGKTLYFPTDNVETEKYKRNIH